MGTPFLLNFQKLLINFSQVEAFLNSFSLSVVADIASSSK